VTTPDRIALVIAVSEYHDPKLRSLHAPAADAARLGAVLEDEEIGGFAVDIAADEEEAQLRRRIARLFNNRRPDDVLLLHFSGHGVKDDRGRLYLAASDTEFDLLDATGIASDWLNEQIERSRSKRIVVMLDCCFSGSFPFGARARAGESVNVQDSLGGRGRTIITASNSMEYSYEGDHLSGEATPSFFTEALAEALETGKADRDQDQWISVDELYDYIYDRVRERTPNQSPMKMGSLEGTFYIARSSYEAPVEPARLDDHLISLMESPIAGARLGAVEELARLLTSSDRAVRFAARNALERLTDDDSRKVAGMAEAALEPLEAPRTEPLPATGALVVVEEPDQAAVDAERQHAPDAPKPQRIRQASSGLVVDLARVCSGIAFDGTWIWVVGDDGSFVKIEEATGHIAGDYRVKGENDVPHSLAVLNAQLWFVCGYTLGIHIDGIKPSGELIPKLARLARLPWTGTWDSRMVAAANALWVWVSMQDSMFRVDPKTREITPVTVVRKVAALTAAPDGFWFVDGDSNMLGHVEARPDPHLTYRIPFDYQIFARRRLPSTLATVGDKVAAVVKAGVVIVDPGSPDDSKGIEIDGISAICPFEERLCVAHWEGGVSWIDPHSRVVSRDPIKLREKPWAAVEGNDAVWIVHEHGIVSCVTT
jgi:hypothetical protein